MMERALDVVNVILRYPWTWSSSGAVIVGIFLVSIPLGGIEILLGIPLVIISVILGEQVHSTILVLPKAPMTAAIAPLVVKRRNIKFKLNPGICFRFYNDSTEIFPVETSERTLTASGQIESSRCDTDSVHAPQIRESRPKMDMRITGSSIIDETLHEMIDFILRDYIHLWFDYISDDDEFVHELRKTIKDTLVTLSSRVKNVNWIPYLTTDLVDDAASHLRLYRQALSKVKDNPNNDLISIFFDLEASMEKNLCRDMVSTDDSHLNDYFQGLSEVLLYLLLPHETYGCSPVGSLAQDLLVNHILIPLLHLLTDSDFVNQCIVWLCQGFSVTPDIFMTVLRTSDTMDELFATLDFFTQQMNELKATSNSASGDELNSIKQQIKCLGYVKKAIEQQISHLKEGKHSDWADTDGEGWQHYFMSGMKLHTLSLEEVIKNSVALSYFLDFMAAVGGNHYLLMYLNADAWRVSGEQQLMVIETSVKNNQTGKDQTKSNKAMLDCMRDAALNIYDQFLSEKAIPRVKLPETVIKRFYIQVKTEMINADLFDEIQRALIEKMQTTEKFFPAFTKSKSYIKCLMELDLLKAETVSAHSASSASDEEEDLTDDLVSLISESDMMDENVCNYRTRESLQNDEFQTCRECLKMKMQSSGIKSDDLLSWEKNVWDRKYNLEVEIIEAALTVEKGKTYGVYVLLATRNDDLRNTKVPKEKERNWHIYRRYSDFYDFHQWIKSKWMRLNKVDFPSKQTFGKTDRSFLEKRMASLNKYLRTILSMTSEPCFGESLQDSLMHFLEPGPYVVRKKHFSEKIDNLVNMTVNPLKQSVKSVTLAVKTMPDTLFNTVDGFTKIFQSRPESGLGIEAMKVGASIDMEDDNIPLRIVLLLMDEVFDLKSRNQWLRRKIVVVIRQVIKAMMGDNLNRRILDYVAHLTGPVKVAGYLRNLQQTLWPDGRKISPGVSRSAEAKLKTRVAAKTSLLASLSDELKHLIGSETTRRGLLCVFDLCQNQVLNQRFLLVLLEGIIKTLYPDKPFPTLIQRLHFRSSRVGKNRPFLVPTKATLKTSTMPIANLSPRGSRKRKT